MQPLLHVSHLQNSTEDEAVPYLRAVVTPTRDQIRERVNKFTSIPSAARAVLIEVCSLVELGGKGRCWASNKELASRACCAEMTVSKHLQALIKAGLILRTYANGDHAKRDLAPSPELIAAYRSEGGLSGVLNGVKWGTERGLSRVRNGVKRGAYQIEDTKEELKEENSTTVIRELENRVAGLQEQLRAATAARATDQEKIASLELENKQLSESGVDKLALAALALAKTKLAVRSLWEALPVVPQQGSALRAAFFQHPACVAKPGKAPSPERALAHTRRQGIIDRYYEWYRGRNNNMRPSLLKQDGEAALTIFQYFRGQDGAETDLDAFNAFEMLLSRWHTLDAFSQKRQTLNEIKNNLTNLITQIAHGQPTNTHHAQQHGLVDNSTRRASLDVLRELS